MDPPINKNQKIGWFPIIKRSSNQKESFPLDWRLLASWRNFWLCGEPAFTLDLQRRSRRLSANAVLG
jgi:hypothetical protein